MAHTTDPPPSPLDTIPDPERIRDRLSTIFGEAQLLRALLRIAERKTVYLERGTTNQGVRHAD